MPYTATGAMTPSTVMFTTVGTLTGLCMGNNTITITDASGCTTTMTVTIGGPSAIAFTTSTSAASSSCDGSITVNATGGTGALAYSNDNGASYQASNIFTSLCSGTYSICVMDANGCVQCQSVTVFPSCAMVSTAGGVVNATCNGVCNGSVVVASTMGTPPYMITLGASTTTYMGATTINGLCAGTYTAMTTDAAGCNSPVTFTITEPTPVTLSLTPIDESFSGACDGEINASPSGGTAPYIYSINGGAYGGASGFTGLCAGSHYVCVKDANNCTTCLTTIVGTASCTFVSTAYVISPPSCHGDCNGTVGVAASGGTPPYTATAGSSTITFTGSGTLTGLCAGVITVNFTDAVGCTSSYTVTMTEPAAISVNPNFTPESAPGACDGTITFGTTGGVSPYTFTIDGSPATGTTGGICGGNHIVCVTDANGCTACDTVFVTTSGCTATTNITTTNVDCFGDCNGTMVIITTGGTMPYMLTTSSGATITYTSVGTLGGLCAGTYTGTVTDASGCTYPVTFTITSPPALTISGTTTPATSGCNGSISISAGGGTPGYTYSIDGGVTFSVSSTFTSVCSGSYTICVQDANGCVQCTTVTVGVSGCTMVTTAIPTTVSCFGTCDATVNFLATGGTPPYTTTIGSLTSTYTSSTLFTGFCAGTYVSNTVDATGCTYIFTFIVSGPSDIVTTATGTNPSTFSSCDGAISATTSGGTPSYLYSWYDCSTGLTIPGNTANQTGLCAGQYAYIVTDANGCTDSITCITLTNPSDITEKGNTHLFNIYPNPTNGLLTVSIQQNSEVQDLVITDVLGQVIAASDIKNKITFDLNAMGLNNGIYFVTITGKNKAKHTQKIVLSR